MLGKSGGRESSVNGTAEAADGTRGRSPSSESNDEKGREERAGETVNENASGSAAAGGPNSTTTFSPAANSRSGVNSSVVWPSAHRTRPACAPDRDPVTDRAEATSSDRTLRGVTNRRMRLVRGETSLEPGTGETYARPGRERLAA